MPDLKKGEFLIAKEIVHRLKNRLNSGTTGLGLIRRQIERGVGQETILATIERVAQGMNVEDAVKETRPSERRSCRALLVEDDENERVLLAGLLEMAGIEVKSVEDGDDALAYLKGNARPDVILLDLNMPRMNGADFAKAVRDQGVESKIFMVTGSEPPTKVPPVDLWLRKPLNPDRLLREIGTLCAVE